MRTKGLVFSLGLPDNPANYKNALIIVYNNVVQQRLLQPYPTCVLLQHRHLSNAQKVGRLKENRQY